MPNLNGECAAGKPCFTTLHPGCEISDYLGYPEIQQQIFNDQQKETEKQEQLSKASQVGAHLMKTYPSIRHRSEERNQIIADTTYVTS